MFKLYDRDPAATTLLQILLVGHPELNPKLSSEKLRLFKKRINLRFQIRPLAREEGIGYIKHRLRLVGRNMSEVLTPDAVSRIWEFAEGVPRIMNVVCDQTFRIGKASSMPKIDAKIVREAVRRISYLRPSRVKSDPGERAKKNISSRVIKVSLALGADLAEYLRENEMAV